MRPGTRMLPWRGISQTHSLTRRSSIATRSDVQDEARPPARRGLADRELVVAHSLDLSVQAMPRGVDVLARSPAGEGPVADRVDGELRERDAIHLQAYEKGVQPVVEERLQVVGR